MTKPGIFVLAGPNGAGETTGASFLLPERLRIERFVNADFIATGITPFSPDSSAIAAGRAMLHRMRELRSQGESFAFESTLASRTLASFLRDAIEAGYLVHIAYVWLSTVDIAISRVSARVQKGGHHVPDEVVRRRYFRSLTNLFELYLPLASTWAICDNTGAGLVPVAEGYPRGGTTVYDKTVWTTIQNQAAHARE